MCCTNSFLKRFYVYLSVNNRKVVIEDQWSNHVGIIFTRVQSLRVQLKKIEGQLNNIEYNIIIINLPLRYKSKMKENAMSGIRMVVYVCVCYT